MTFPDSEVVANPNTGPGYYCQTLAAPESFDVKTVAEPPASGQQVTTRGVRNVRREACQDCQMCGENRVRG